MRNTARTIGDMWEEILRLSDLSNYSHREDGVTLRRRAHRSSYLREKGELYAPRSLIIPRVEPRALSLRHGAHRTPWVW